MEKIQLLERSSGSLQPTGHYQDMDPHVIPETTPAPGSARQNTSQSDTCPCQPNSSCLMPLVLALGFCLLLGPLPPHPKLPANSRPVCYRQETDFCLRAGRVSEESTESSAGAQAFSKTQPVTYTASHCPRGLCYAAELCIEAARDCLGAERIFTWPREITVCSTAAGGSRPNSSNFRGTKPAASRLTNSTTPRQGSGQSSDFAHRATKSLFST